MIISNLKGGLGNQMFQFAIGYALSKSNGTDLFLDVRFLNEYSIKNLKGYVKREYSLDLFGIELKTPSKYQLFKVLMFFPWYSLRIRASFLFDKLGIFVMLERGRKYEERIFRNSSKNIYLDGHWQCQDYFFNYRGDLLKIFNFDRNIELDINKKFLKKLDLDNSVCMHVRRTDFINSKEHDVVGKSYYLTAMNKFESLMGKNINFYIFSDDIEWCKANFNEYLNVYFMDERYIGERDFNYLYLMTIFKKFIIPNSSFSWWAAWLSKYEDKVVIAPKIWSGFGERGGGDIVPDSWLRI